MTDIQQFSANEQKLIELLGLGISQRAAAGACGVSESRVSQLMATPAFSAEVSARRVGALKEGAERDSNYDRLEDKVLSKLEQSLFLVSKPMELTRILSVLNQAKRRSTEVGDNNAGVQAIVQITLPTTIINQHKLLLSGANQVLQIDGKDLAPLGINQLEALHAEQQQKVNVPKLSDSTQNRPPKLSDIE